MKHVNERIEELSAGEKEELIDKTFENLRNLNWCKDNNIKDDIPTVRNFYPARRISFYELHPQYKEEDKD